MKRIFTAPLILTCTLYTTVACASEHDSGWDFYIGATAWQTEGNGNLKAPDYNGYNLDLPESNKNANSVLFFTLEHPNRFLPNIKVSANSVQQEAAGTLNFSLLPTPAIALATIDLSHTDLTLYYQPVNNTIMHLDIGISARALYGTLDVNFTLPSYNISSRSKSDLSATLPLLYGNILFNIPFGFSAAITASAGDDGKQSSQDISAQLNYESPIGLGVSAGYRHFSTSLESQAKTPLGTFDITADTDIKGPFATVFYHF